MGEDSANLEQDLEPQLSARSLAEKILTGYPATKVSYADPAGKYLDIVNPTNFVPRGYEPDKYLAAVLAAGISRKESAYTSLMSLVWKGKIDYKNVTIISSFSQPDAPIVMEINEAAEYSKASQTHYMIFESEKKAKWDVKPLIYEAGEDNKDQRVYDYPQKNFTEVLEKIYKEQQLRAELNALAEEGQKLSKAA